MNTKQTVELYSTYHKSNDFININFNDEIVDHKRIIVIGYYDHRNMGDDQYLYAFNYINNHFLKVDTPVLLIDCDKLFDFDILPGDVIFVGGGDILNDYFLDKINNKFSTLKNKIIAVSVGSPYIGTIVNTNKLHVIDFLFVRTRQDLEIISHYFNPDHVFYIPDISILSYNYYLELNQPKKKSIIHGIPLSSTGVYSIAKFASSTVCCGKNQPGVLKTIEKITKRIIAFSLNRHIYEKNNKQYDNIVQNIADTVVFFIKQNYFIVFVPFNTSINTEESDIIIHREVYSIIKNNNPELIKNILLIEENFSPLEVVSLYKFFYFYVPMRFHAVLFSIYGKIPFVPVFTTKKIKNILLDIDFCGDYYELKKDVNDIPLELESSVLIEKIEKNINKYIVIRNSLENAYETLYGDLLETMDIFVDKVKRPYEKSKSNCRNKNKDIIETIFQKINIFLEGKSGLRSAPVTDYRKEEIDESTKDEIVTMVSFHLTKSLYSKYNHGLREKMFMDNFNFYEEWKWILCDFHTNNVPLYSNHRDGLFNLHYMNQEDTSCVHRSGWRFVYDNIKKYHNNSSNLLLDMYIDRTFHWEKRHLKNIGIVPYKKDWIGFLHHTFDTTFSSYNNANLLKDADFLESLKYCKGIFVLSNFLKKELMIRLSEIGQTIPIYSLIHPTEQGDDVEVFSFEKFKKNEKKQLLHIGGWLRNIFSFYQLELPEELGIQKTVLKNNGNNYLPEDDFMKKLSVVLRGETCDEATTADRNIYFLNSTSNVSQNKTDTSSYIYNNWYRHFFDYMNSMFKNVHVLDKLSNNEYDQMLTKNVVFIHLVDGSAVNTLTECMTRNTPIFVNRHPAVVELLGDKYPLYYDIPQDVPEMLKNHTKIKNAYIYLSKIDKSIFHVNTFMENFLEIVNKNHKNDKNDKNDKKI